MYYLGSRANEDQKKLNEIFSKYKNYISDNISIGITDLSLSIPAFESKLEQEEIKKAMEGVKVKQIKEWSITNTGHTQTKKDGKR